MSLVLLCSGQGGQHPGMFGRVGGNARAQPVLNLASELLGAPIEQIAAEDGRFRNAVAQPLVCAAALAHWEGLRDALPPVTAVAGYSAGELAAHAVAGSFDTATCLRLALKRARLMDAATPGDAGLLAVIGLDDVRIARLCAAHGIFLAIVNGPDHVVLGGTRAALTAASAEAATSGARVVPLPVCVPAHTPLLTVAAQGFEDALHSVTLRPPGLRLLAGIDGRVVGDVDRVVATLSAQISQPLQWHVVLQQAVERGGRVFLELGPGAALSRRARELHPQLEARSVEDFQTLEGVLEWVDRACARA
ncbi:[acyl-carrier-protein] S-malonyltransferase [Stenotrophomonas rhizophila]|uniref:malonate decarboxylase subunit epsilon n=1 Tax=Stenotrophomonas rhizophila TaxID=216778 RepID=UPI000F4B2772|nr:malonate decarboxylase subunit epsilon [Stenotrophomonas rhizophila]ROP80324.1 [acyl-carrier-protein] S-malonyltransferase [Stenotrophomonas rhizophila]